MTIALFFLVALLILHVMNGIAFTKSFEVKTPDIVIKVNPERTDLVETAVINGRRCLVIQITDQVEVNGIQIRNNCTDDDEDIL